MKKNIFSATILAAAAALAGCSNDVLETPAQNHDITVSVTTTNAMSRAGVEAIDGYELKCIMQLVDSNGAIVGSQKTESAASGTATFTITGAEQEAGAVQALFWAEYQPTAEGEKVYNTADLTAITYNTTNFDFGAKNINICDAFAGKLSEIKAGQNVTLSRPFSKLSFVPANPTVAAGCNSIEVKFSTPSTFSVLSGATTTTQAVTYTSASFNPDNASWFEAFIFGGQTNSKLESEINITVSGDKTFNLVLPANSIPTDANWQVNATGTISDTPVTQDITVTVEINGEWNKPEAPKFEVGAYVNAAGEPVATADEAVAVVFATEAIGADNIDAYPAEFAGKTIKGYAVALNNITVGRQAFGEAVITGLTQNSPTNGSMSTLYTTEPISTQAIGTQWSKWNESNKTNGNNVTEWYVPALAQLEAWFAMIGNDASGNEPTGTEAFKALFPWAYPGLFDREALTAVNYASTSVNQNANISCVQISSTNWKSAQISVSTQGNQSALVRPMFTIFE